MFLSAYFSQVPRLLYCPLAHCWPLPTNLLRLHSVPSLMSLRHPAVVVSVLNPKGPHPVTSWVRCLLFSPSDHDLSKTSEQPLSAPSNTSHLVPCTYVHPSGLLAVFLSCRYCFPPTDSARRPRELGGLRTILCSEICGKKRHWVLQLFFHMATLSNGPTLSLLSLLLLMYLQKPFFLPLTFSTSCNSSWALAFLTVSLRVPTYLILLPSSLPPLPLCDLPFRFSVWVPSHNASSWPAHLISSPCPVPTLRAIPLFTWSLSRVTAQHFDDTDTFLPYSQMCNSKHNSVTCKIKISILA